MGQKIHPGGLRVGIIHDWRSNWFTEKEFSDYLIEDVNIRRHINGKLAHAGISDILIRKDKQKVTVDIYTARPGIVIGKSGIEVDALRKEIGAMTCKGVHININEIKRPELDAKLVAQGIAEQLENRVAFRRAMKRSLARPCAPARTASAFAAVVASAVPRWRASRATARAACRCTRSAPTSTTASSRPRRRMAASGSRCGSTRARCCPRASSPGACASMMATSVVARAAVRARAAGGEGGGGGGGGRWRRPWSWRTRRRSWSRWRRRHPVVPAVGGGAPGGNAGGQGRAPRGSK